MNTEYHNVLSGSWYTWMIYLYIVKLVRIMRDTLLIYCRDFMTTNCSPNERNANFGKLKLSILVAKLAIAK